MKARYIPNTIVSKGASDAGWLFGDPVVRAGGNGMAGWAITNTLSQLQKGGGWVADLYGGSQTGAASWAACYIPVNELPLTQLTEMDWSWYQTNTEAYGLGVVIWIHDPNDFDKRAEISQSGSATSLDKGAGQNSHEFPSTAAEFFFYGEGETGNTTCTTEGTLYTWAQFQADALFSTWSVYRISFENGWYSTGTFESMYLEEVKINGMYIPLKPQPGERTGFETKTVFLATAAPSTTAVPIATPVSGHRIRVQDVFMNTASNAAAQFEVYFDTGANITSDTTKAIAACTLDTDTQTFETVQFGDYGPIGVVDDMVYIRTSADITTNGNFTIVYHEE